MIDNVDPDNSITMTSAHFLRFGRIGKRVTLNIPFVVNLCQDPFERFSSESMEHFPWMADKLWAFVPTQVVVCQFLQSFREYPPSQKSGSFGVDQALQAIQAGSQGGEK